MTAFQARVLEIAPLAELEQDARTWDDSIVFVRAGMIDVVCTNGDGARFHRGDILCLAPLSVHAVRNPAETLARLLLITRSTG
jgi:quercetin dioxygenase-like cupin family protein